MPIYGLDAITPEDGTCREVLPSLSEGGLISPDREPDGDNSAVLTLGYAYIPTIDDEEVYKNRDVLKTIRHYVLGQIWLQDKEGIDIRLSDRELSKYEKMLQRLNIRRVRDFSTPLYDLANYKNIWRI